MRAIIPETHDRRENLSTRVDLVRFSARSARAASSIVLLASVCPRHCEAWCIFVRSRASAPARGWSSGWWWRLLLRFSACARGGRHGNAQFRQRRHRGGREGGRGDHRPQLRDRPEGQGDGQHHLGAAGPEKPRLPHASLRAPAAGLRGRRKRRRRQDRARGRREAAGRRRVRRAGGGRRRPARDRGDRAAVRVGAPARQRAAAAHHAEQRDRRLSERQRVSDHRLRGQPAADRADHRLPRPAAGRRAHHRAGPLCVGARHRGAAQPAARRYARAPRDPACRPTSSSA